MPTFTRQERLKSRKTIARLFREGHSYMAYPFRVVWLEIVPLAPPAPPGGGENASPLSSEPTLLPLPTSVAGGWPPSPPSGGLGGGKGTHPPVGFAVSVPKKHFKTAVQRNRLKRQIREAYRLHKHELYAKTGDRPLALMLMYIAKEPISYAEIEAGVKKMVRKFTR